MAPMYFQSYPEHSMLLEQLQKVMKTGRILSQFVPRPFENSRLPNCVALDCMKSVEALPYEQFRTAAHCV